MSDEAKIARLEEIREQIKALALEGVKIADEEGVLFNLADATFADCYGAGNLEYYPDNDDYPQDEDQYGNSTRGMWMSSNSWGC